MGSNQGIIISSSSNPTLKSGYKYNSKRPFCTKKLLRAEKAYFGIETGMPSRKISIDEVCISQGVTSPPLDHRLTQELNGSQFKPLSNIVNFG